MAFNPSRLYALLLNTGLAIKDNPLYQVIRDLIDGISKLSTAVFGSPSSSGSGVLDQPYITEFDSTSILPNSRYLVAGNGIAFDTSTPGQFEVSTEELGYWTPLSDGDTDEMDLIAANGECIVVFVPV